MHLVDTGLSTRTKKKILPTKLTSESFRSWIHDCPRVPIHFNFLPNKGTLGYFTSGIRVQRDCQRAQIKTLRKNLPLNRSDPEYVTVHACQTKFLPGTNKWSLGSFRLSNIDLEYEYGTVTRTKKNSGGQQSKGQ